MRWLAVVLVVVASAEAAASTRCELAGPVLPAVARGYDREAPRAPVIVVHRGRETTLAVGDGTARILIERGRGTEWTTTMVLLASEHACDLELERAATGGCLRVTAFDLAGNASDRAQVCDEQLIPVALLSDPRSTAASARSASAIVVIGFIVALVIGFFIVFAPEIDMGWLRRRAHGDDLLPAAARQLARTACHDAIVRGFGVAVGATGAIIFASPTVAAYVGLGAALLLLRQIWVYNRARRMLLLLADEPTVTLHGDHVLRVRSRGDFSWLVCSQRQLATATERVLPLARIV